MTRLPFLVLLLVAGLLCPVSSHADDAAVLVKGMWRLYVDSLVDFTVTKQFDENGKVEPLGAFLSVPLNSNVFTALRPLNPLVPGGNASFGTSHVTIRRSFQVHTFQPAYGLTDRLSVGVIVRYFRIQNNLDASVDSSPGSGANVGFNGAVPGGVAPLAVPGTRRATTQDIQNLLASQFGMKAVQTTLTEGLGDTDVGGRYQYYRSENFRAAFTGGVRIPTGTVNDPDNLVDTSTGSGAWALLFRLQQDVMFGGTGLSKRLGFPTPGTGFINTTFLYDLNLPSKQEARVCSTQFPLCTQKEVVNRHVGDTLAGEVSGRYGVLLNGLILSATYRYVKKFDDHVTGNKGFDYGSLAADSGVVSHEYIAAITYTTIPLVIQKKLRWPLSFSVGYRERFAGENAAKAQSIFFNAQAFF